jgi:twitching motility protein PilT
MRRIPSQFLTFEQLRTPEAIRGLIVRPRGMLLVTGPTGSGKTTSLASMINFINDNYDRHVITLEDPIEYFHRHKKCTVNQREIGIDVPDFKEGIRRALRMDPDVILVGEMRDLETIRAALEAAETGHLVFATLHTSGAASTIDRVVTVFPENEQAQIRTQLAGALIGVLSQAILPRKPEGLVAAYEMMVVTPAIRNLIRENKVYRIDSSIQTGRKHGMYLLDESLFRLWKEGICDKEEVLLKSSKPNELAAKIAQAEKGLYDDDEDGDGEDEDDEDEDEDEEEDDED